MRDAFLRWTVAFPVAVKDFLRGECGPDDELAGILGSKHSNVCLEAVAIAGL